MVYYEKEIVGIYYADIVVNDAIIVEIKSGHKINMHHIRQAKNYLAATGLELGIVISFDKYFSFKTVFG